MSSIFTLLIENPKPLIMGILNLTTDSFSDGGLFTDVDKALFHAEKLIKDGADILDIGAESSRPGAAVLSSEDERFRLEPFLKVYRSRFDVPLSLDTYKSEIAEFGLGYGISLINDITGLQGDPNMAAVVAKAGVPIVVMHMQNTPQTMQLNPTYTDVVADVKAFLKKSCEISDAYGITDVIIDPGIGFGKTLQHNVALLNRLDDLLELGRPILIGTSRKSFLGQLTGDPVTERLEGTVVSTIMAIEKGARIVRVHDVLSMKKAITVYCSIKGAYG